MSGIFSGTIAAGLLAAVAMVAAGYDGPKRPLAAEHSPYSGRAFQLQVGGDAGNCVVEKVDADMSGSARLTFNSVCEGLYPRIANASFWSESQDGSVAFTRADGAVVIEFSVSDGAAYESFQPGAPLAALIALN